MAHIQNPAFLTPTVLPFAPGEGPFKVKGSAYVAGIEYVEKNLPGGLKAVLDNLRDPRINAFFAKPFSVSEWYDAYPGALAQWFAARMLNVPFEKHTRAVAAFQVQIIGSKIYAPLLRLISSDAIARWGPRMSSIYMDFTRVESQIVGNKEVSFTMREVPNDLLQAIIFTSCGFCEAALRFSGAKEPNVQPGDVLADGERFGRQLSQVKIRFTWG